MMMLSEISKALDGKMLGPDVRVNSIGTDSRSIVEKQLFVAIKGDRFDGNGYASEAIKRGAAAALISDEVVEASPAVLVDDTRLALGQLAQYWRQQLDLPLVAVTGSNGKTTVKEMIASILQVAGGNVLATKGNFNNDIGMPLTLLNMRAEHTSAVIEMGMSHLGEIRYLTNIASPQVAVVNNAGTAHIGELGSREAIAEAKGEIFEGLVDGGIAVVNADDDFAEYWMSLNESRQVITFGLTEGADVSAQYSTENNMTQMRLTTPEGVVDIVLGVLGQHNVSNALAASAVAVALDVSNIDIAEGLACFDGVQGRLHLLAGKHGATVVDDTYNANPDSMKAAIDVLISQRKQVSDPLIFVMGDMGELGPENEAMHAEVGAYAKQQGVPVFYSFGQSSQAATATFGAAGQHFDTLENLITAISQQLNEDAVVLVKGSRFMKMERVVHAIVEEQKVEGAN